MPPLPDLDKVQHLQIMLWILCGIIVLMAAIAVPVISYFLAREFNRKDRIEDRGEKDRRELTQMFNEGMNKFSTSLDDVSSVVGELKDTLSALREWSNDRFVSHYEFEESMRRLATADREIKETIEKEFKRCKEFCPVRQNMGGK